MSRTQERWSRASFTDRFRRRLPIALKRLGANDAVGPSGSQESVQNLAEAPSPKRTLIDALNIASMFFSVRDGRRAQAEVVSVRRSHSHLSRSANLDLQVGDAEPAVILWGADNRPCNLAFTTRRGLIPSPEEGPGPAPLVDFCYPPCRKAARY